MNAISLWSGTAGGADWEALFREVNAWRGQALQYFAQAELAVSETLLAMKSTAAGATSVRLRPLVGQRFEDLGTAVGPEGAFAAEGEKSRAALSNFRRYESIRVVLCHGTAKLALDRHGHWLVVLKVLAFRAGQESRSSLALEKREAEALLSELKSANRALVSALQSLRDRIRTDDRPPLRGASTSKPGGRDRPPCPLHNRSS